MVANDDDEDETDYDEGPQAMVYQLPEMTPATKKPKMDRKTPLKARRRLAPNKSKKQSVQSNGRQGKKVGLKGAYYQRKRQT